VPQFRLAAAWLTSIAVVCSCATAAGEACNQPATRADPEITLRSVRVVRQGDSTTVVIDADGPLPQPRSAALSDPPRIYLDLNGVSTGRIVPGEVSDPVVRRTRVAEHTTTPLITRIVVDLVSATSYRVNATGREQGRLVIILGTADLGRATALAAAAGGRTAAAQPRAAAGRSAASIESYGMRIAGALLRLHALRPVLVAIDKRTDDVSGDSDAAAAEFDSIGNLLSGIPPPAGRESTHALLTRACAFGGRAVRMRQEAIRTNDPGWNAASAAAGALLMLDRANTELTADRK
jgi:hypothetical protein